MSAPWHLLLGLSLFMAPLGELHAQASKPTPAKASKKRKKTGKRPKKAAPPEEAKAVAVAPAELEEQALEEEPEGTAAPVERKGSKLTAGATSRWSNQGAMEPIESELPIQAELPERAKPKAAGVVTPGQSWLDNDNQFSAHVSLYMSHLQTVRQDDRSIDLLRAKAAFDYDRIAGSDFGVHLDLNYWPKLSERTLRPTAYRVNAAYLSWGFMDFRRPEGPDLGVAVGRVAIPEAGGALADGAAVRYRFAPGVKAGVFGGFAGNPYRYNWSLQQTEDFSTDYITGGGFFSFQRGAFFGNAAAVLYLANQVSARQLDGAVVERSGLDRFYTFVDLAYVVTEELSLFLNGWLDFNSTPALLSQQFIQNLELVTSWRPRRDLDFRLSLGRFSTVIYGESFVGTFGPVNPNVEAPVIVDDEGLGIVPFDGVLQRAIYNNARLRAGFRIIPELEPFALFDLYLRDTSDVPALQPFASLRALPQGGLRYRHPDVVDAELRVGGIIDEQAVNDVMLAASVGRGWMGLRLDLDGRAFLGETNAYDGGVMLSYRVPREWLPGRLLVRGMFRYYRENVALFRPNPDLPEQLFDEVLPLVPTQESFYGMFGIDWRL